MDKQWENYGANMELFSPEERHIKPEVTDQGLALMSAAGTTIVDGLESAPEVLIGLLEGKNVGKLLRIASE